MKNEVFKKYKNKHEGKRVFLIANGPSLSKTNLDLIKDEYSIAMNRISLLYNQVEWRPTYYLFSSTNVRPDKPWASKWLSSVWDAIECKKTTPFIASIFKESCFSTDVIDRIDKTGTTMNLALQLSLHMGFKEIVFVGADLGWTKDLATNNDPNHFSKDYTADIPRPYKANNQMRNVHSLAIKKIHELRPDVNFYNASLSTVLDVYPIIDFEKYVIEGNLTYREKDLENAKQFWDKPPQYSTLT